MSSNKGDDAKEGDDLNLHSATVIVDISSSNRNTIVPHQQALVSRTSKHNNSLFKSTFVGADDMTSLHIAQAIAGKLVDDPPATKQTATATTGTLKDCTGGTSSTPNLYLKAVPSDFIPLKASLTDKEVEDRMAQWTAFDKRTGDDFGKPSQDLIAKENVKQRVLNVRSMLKKVSTPIIKNKFVKSFKAAFPGYKFKNGTREVNSIQDLATVVRTEPYGNSVCKMVFFGLHGVWDSDNGVFLEMEKEVANEFGWTFTQYRTDGTQMQRESKGSCFKQNMVRQKNILMSPVRNAVKRIHRESILVRKLDLSEKAVNKRNARKKNPDDLEDEFPRKIIAATPETYGFRGYLGLLDGHPLLKEPTIEAIKKPDAKGPANVGATDESLVDFVKKCTANGSVKCKADLVKELITENPGLMKTLIDTNPFLLDGTLSDDDDEDDNDLLRNPFRFKYVETGMRNEEDLTATVQRGVAAMGPLAVPVTPAQKKKAPGITTTPPPGEVSTMVADGDGDDHLGESKSVPSTPTKKKDDLSTAEKTKTPSPRSRKKRNEPPESPCRHEQELGNFVELDGRYFTAAFLSGKENHPTECAGEDCGVVFTGDKDTVGKHKVLPSKPVHACKNAHLRDDHKCVYALCHKCHEKMLASKQSSSRSDRPRKRRIVVNSTNK